ncbi:MAG: hypothetical protein EOP84_34115, partial [Verrucomicrobiaceae bacterium]
MTRLSQTQLLISSLISVSSSPVYLGADVSKATIDCRLLNQAFSISNDSSGFTQLLSRFKRLKTSQVHVVCEATGGYQNKLVGFLHDKRIAVSAVNPRRTPDCALNTIQAKVAQLLATPEGPRLDAFVSAASAGHLLWASPVEGKLEVRSGATPAGEVST